MRRLTMLLLSLLIACALPALSVRGAGVAGDDQADGVWGQPDMITNDNAAGSTGTCLAPPTASSLCLPQQVAFDTAGNMWVADDGNNRVLMYPYNAASGRPSTTATKVFGQGGSFNTKVSNNGGLSAYSLGVPVGVAIDSRGTLFVSDNANNRILVYFNALSKPASPAADMVLGQDNYTSGSVNGDLGNSTTCPAPAPASACSLNNPFYLSLDAQGDLLVADELNNRVLLWPAADFAPTGNPFGTSCAPPAVSGCFIPATMVWGQSGSFYRHQPPRPPLEP